MESKIQMKRRLNLQIFTAVLLVASFLTARAIQAHQLGLIAGYGALCNHGMFQLEHGDYAAALKSMEAAINLQPRRPIAYYVRGEAYEKLDRPQLAVQAYKMALRMSPDWTAPTIRLNLIIGSSSGKAIGVGKTGR